MIVGSCRRKPSEKLAVNTVRYLPWLLGHTPNSLKWLEFQPETLLRIQKSRKPRCPLLALSGQLRHNCVCPLLEQQQTLIGAGARLLGR